MSRILGVDPGARRCGLAITDSARTLAFPRPALDADASFLVKLCAIVQEEAVGLVVVGHPLALAGTRTASTDAASALYEAIAQALAPIPVIQWDERWTTREARRSLSGAGIKAKDQRGRIDSAAAVILLQNYVDGLHAD